MGSAAPPTSFLIRPARPVDTAAARIMLPEAFATSPTPILFVAREDRVPAPLGLAALSHTTLGWDPEGFRFAMAVAPPYRRRGVGRALLGAVVAECRRWAMRSLWSWGRVADGPGADFLRANGFRCAKRYLRFEAELARLGAVIRPVRERIAKAGGGAADVRVVPLPAAPAEAVAALHERHLGGDAATLRARIAGHGPNPLCRVHSHVLLNGGEVAGAILISCEGPVADVETYVVDPEQRRSRAGVLLVEAPVSLGLATGTTHIRFSCWEDVRDTVKLARRAGGRITETEGQYVLDVPRMVGDD